jgi:hypothetical protein
MKKLILIFGALIAFISPLLADGKLNPCHYSTEGKDFWFGLMQNRFTGAEHYTEITVSSRKGAQFTVTYGPGETLIDSFVVTADSSQTVRIDYELLEATGSENVEDKGIHLISTDSVNVYALNYRTRSSDVAVIYPTESLGKEYFAMCYTPHPTQTVESNSEFLIVASVDYTTVKITPTVDTDRGKKANITYSISLNRGQSYQVQSMDSNIAGQGDLTGTAIVSDQPIAFYSGAKSTAIPYTGQSRDHLYEQIPPTNTWGREFYIVPLRLRSKDTYRILAAEDGTIVTVEGLGKSKTLNRGAFWEFDLASNKACRVIASKKILLAQFCRSQEADEVNGVGDPFMIILSPMSQRINDVTFVAYETDLIRDIFFVNIITKTSEVGNITFDGSAIRSAFRNFPKGGYSYAQLPITKGTHRLENPDLKNGGFLAYVYGFGNNNNTESYGYGVGFNLDIQLEIGGSFDYAKDTLVICQGSEIKLEAGEYFETYWWNTGKTTPSISVTEQGMYSVTATTVAGCQKTDSLFVKVDSPKISLGKDTAVCLPGEFVIQPAKGFVQYIWQDGFAGQTFTVESSGDYSVTVTNEKGCQASDTIHVDVLMPRLSFTPDYRVVTINHPDITFINQTAGALYYNWDFGDGTGSREISPSHHYPNIGRYHVVLEAVNNLGCSDTLRIDVEVIPIKFFIPNAFRPDSDIPKNRVFKPFLNAADPKNYNFEVYNRIGSSIFKSLNPENGWQGTGAEQGIYVWMLRYLDIQGYEHLQKGTVMLVR